MSTPWYRVVSPREEVRAGRSFHPDEFAIHLDQVVEGRGPVDYTDAAKFFARTSFTRALTENAGLVLRRLAGETANTAPVLSLVTQFGGGKTHTLTTLYHLARNGDAARADAGVQKLLAATFLPSIPQAKVGIFVGQAWDPQPGRETPWIDLARQLAGDEGVALLGPEALTAPPGTGTLQKLFYAAGGPVLLLFDEVLNYLNRYHNGADAFYSFIHNLTVAMTGTTNAALVVSLPRSQVEMTDWDVQWEERIKRVVGRVATNLVANDEAEITDVLRRRLFENLGSATVRSNVARAYADWCFDHSAQLPAEWTAVDTSRTSQEARAFLTRRFEDAYPFHPSTISVFHRKWSTVPMFQATRGTLAMLAQWVSLAYSTGYRDLRDEPLLTLGSAPLQAHEFRGVVLGQLGEQRLLVPIDADIAGDLAHARTLDADTKDALKDIHRRVGSAIFFESSGGMVSQQANLPELRFAVGGPEVDTTSVDNAAHALEAHAFYVRQIGTDGYRISYKPTLKKVVSERRASLDYTNDILPAMRKLVREMFERGRTLPLTLYPADEQAVDDSPKLSLVVLDPDTEWNEATRARLATWTQQRGTLRRRYPAALIWCVCQPGTRLRSEVQDWLAWLRVQKDVTDGVLGGELTASDKEDVQAAVREQHKEAISEVWASYRYLAYYDPAAPDKLGVIDLGSGHAVASETLSGRVMAALKSQSLLNTGVGSEYMKRNWPPSLLQTGAWPLTGLRQSFLDGTLTRLPDPDDVLTTKIAEWVANGDFGLGSTQHADGSYDRVWFNEIVLPDEVRFEAGLFLLRKEKAAALKAPEPVVIPPAKPETGGAGEGNGEGASPMPPVTPGEEEGGQGGAVVPPEDTAPVALHLHGTVPPDSWNRLGTRLIPKLRAGNDLRIELTATVTAPAAAAAQQLRADIIQALEDLELGTQFDVTVE
jgi:hypothetical protein